MPLKDELVMTVRGDVPEGWSLGHATIRGLNHDEKIAIEALRCGSFAVHETIGGNWRLSHAPTGLQIWTFGSRRQALELAKRIEAFTDWSAIKDTLPKGSELYPKVREVVHELEDDELTQ